MSGKEALAEQMAKEEKLLAQLAELNAQLINILIAQHAKKNAIQIPPILIQDGMVTNSDPKPACVNVSFVASETSDETDRSEFDNTLDNTSKYSSPGCVSVSNLSNLTVPNNSNDSTLGNTSVEKSEYLSYDISIGENTSKCEYLWSDSITDENTSMCEYLSDNSTCENTAVSMTMCSSPGNSICNNTSVKSEYLCPDDIVENTLVNISKCSYVDTSTVDNTSERITECLSPDNTSNCDNTYSQYLCGSECNILPGKYARENNRGRNGQTAADAAVATLSEVLPSPTTPPPPPPQLSIIHCLHKTHTLCVCIKILLILHHNYYNLKLGVMKLSHH